MIIYIRIFKATTKYILFLKFKYKLSFLIFFLLRQKQNIVTDAIFNLKQHF